MIERTYSYNTAILKIIYNYLHGTPAQLYHLKQHHVFHAILLVVAIYPTSSLYSFAFLACTLLPLLPTLEQKSI